MSADNWVPIQAYIGEILTMTDQRITRSKAGLIIEDLEFEPVEAISSRACHSCAFVTDDDACEAHACLGRQFPDGHPLKGKGKLIIWVRKG